MEYRHESLLGRRKGKRKQLSNLKVMLAHPHQERICGLISPALGG